uniref:Uncharacterized protein n=1 Tax=Oryza sativa subsp. japonica TaxID=39947 RepID=Q65X49_ORYSJ|nr:hypothetical protein [Oryza sativa Japonica Group]AAU43999.1 hypothetical protein [Oryza sativa Japonica Group]
MNEVIAKDVHGRPVPKPDDALSGGWIPSSIETMTVAIEGQRLLQHDVKMQPIDTPTVLAAFFSAWTVAPSGAQERLPNIVASGPITDAGNRTRPAVAWHHTIDTTDDGIALPAADEAASCTDGIQDFAKSGGKPPRPMATVSPGLFSYYDPIPIGRSRCADQKGPTHFAGPPPGPARRAAVKSSCAAGLAAPLPRRAPVHVAAGSRAHTTVPWRLYRCPSATPYVRVDPPIEREMNESGWPSERIVDRNIDQICRYYSIEWMPKEPRRSRIHWLLTNASATESFRWTRVGLRL